MWREYRGMTGKELAEKTGLAAPYMSQLENGNREGTIDTFKKIAAALRVDIDDIAYALTGSKIGRSCPHP